MSCYFPLEGGQGPKGGTVAPCSGRRAITFNLTILHRISLSSQPRREEERYENWMGLEIINCSRLS